MLLWPDLSVVKSALLKRSAYLYYYALSLKEAMQIEDSYIHTEIFLLFSSSESLHCTLAKTDDLPPIVS